MKAFYQRNNSITGLSYRFEKTTNNYWLDKLDQLKEHPQVFAVIVFRHKENEAGLSMEILW